MVAKKEEVCQRGVIEEGFREILVKKKGKQEPTGREEKGG